MANYDTILLYYNSIGIPWISWCFCFEAKFFPHCCRPDSDIHDIHEHNQVSHTPPLLSTQVQNVESNKTPAVFVVCIK